MSIYPCGICKKEVSKEDRWSSVKGSANAGIITSAYVLMTMNMMIFQLLKRQSDFPVFNCWCYWCLPFWFSTEPTHTKAQFRATVLCKSALDLPLWYLFSYYQNNDDLHLTWASSKERRQWCHFLFGPLCLLNLHREDRGKVEHLLSRQLSLTNKNYYYYFFFLIWFVVKCTQG